MIQPSNDAKVHNRSSQKNTFGLLPGPEGTCPYATTSCGGCWAPMRDGLVVNTCYVDKLMRARPNVRGVLARNTSFLKGCTEDQMEEALTAEFTRFEAAERKAKAVSPFWYRLNWAGDIFSKEYARALTKAMAKFPGTNFWTYSRSWELIEPGSLDLKNLSLILSLDPVNEDAGLAWLKKNNPNRKFKIGISLMGNICSASLEQYAKAEGLKLFACPVDDSGKMELEGACQKCTACLRRSDKLILFKTK